MKPLLIILLLILVSSLANAEMYKWVAENGSVTFKDTPPPTSQKTKKVKVYTENDFDPTPPFQPETTKRSSKKAIPTVTQAAVPKKERFNGTVEIYLTDWCGYCKQALRYMDSKGIPYVAYNIEKDDAAKTRHKELGGRGVPLIIIGPNKMNGFSQSVMEKYLNN